MNYRKGNSRARYASVLFAAALAALVTACSKQDASNAATIHLSESVDTADSADMPEVVITASRERPKAIG